MTLVTTAPMAGIVDVRMRTPGVSDSACLYSCVPGLTSADSAGWESYADIWGGHA
jgi:hypothetical protein